VNGFHRALRFPLFGGRLYSGEIMGEREWLGGCGQGGRGLMMRGATVEAEVEPLDCWTVLEDGVVCVAVFVCGRR